MTSNRLDEVRIGEQVRTSVFDRRQVFRDLIGKNHAEVFLDGDDELDNIECAQTELVEGRCGTHLGGIVHLVEPLHGVNHPSHNVLPCQSCPTTRIPSLEIECVSRFPSLVRGAPRPSS